MFRPANVLFALLLAVSFLSAQDAADPQKKKSAELIDEFGAVTECEFRGRMDFLLASLAQRPDHRAYIINYLGTDTLPGDRDKYVRERMIANHISFRNFDRSPITFVRGGFRQTTTTELWLIPPGAGLPPPSRTVPEPKVPFGKTFLFAKSYMLTDDGDEDPLDEFILASVRAREEAEEKAWLAENVDATNDAEPADVPAGVVSAEPADHRKSEEKAKAGFDWVNVGLARLLAERKNDTGLIIFYADDLRYDIGQVMNFIRRGRDLLAEHGPIKASRLRVQFGGYRDTPQVEFFVIPHRGSLPVAKPDDRPVENFEEQEN